MRPSELAKTPYPPDPDPDAEAIADVHGLIDASVHDRDWANTSARRLAALRSELRQCRLTGSELGESTLVDVTFADCRLDLVGLRHARLERVCFRDCILDELDLAGATLKDVRFERCRMAGAVLSVASATRVEIAGCDLLGVGPGAPRRREDRDRRRAGECTDARARARARDQRLTDREERPVRPGRRSAGRDPRRRCPGGSSRPAARLGDPRSTTPPQG